MNDLMALGLNPLNRTLSPVVQDIPVMPQHSAVTQLQMHTRPYEHKPFTSPFNGVPEAFAQGVYESPGELARLGEAVGSVSLPGMVANMMGYKSGFSDWVDEQTGVNELGYNPDDYEATKALQGLARMGGNVVGDPLNAIPGGYLAGKFGKELGSEIVNQSLKPGMSKQAGMIGSVKAKNADLEALGKAQEMKAEGIDADTIYQNTKWWLDHPDGKPRFEIDDSGAGLSNNARRDIKDYGVRREESFMPHDELYGAYPDAADISVMHTSRADNGSSGAYRRDDDSISLNLSQLQGDPDLKSTNLHELQHAIQQREGMARGGSPEMFREINKQDARLTQIQTAMEARFNEIPESLQDAARTINRGDDVSGEAMRAIQSNPQAKEAWRNYTEAHKEYRNVSSAKADYLKRYNLDGVVTPYDQYQQLAGETEARLVQDRMDMPMAERLTAPFYKGYDVPLDEQIVRYGNEDSLSRNGEKALP